MRGRPRPARRPERCDGSWIILPEDSQCGTGLRRCLSSIHLMRHGQQFWENPEYSLHIEILCSCESSNGKIRDEWEVRMMRKVTFGGASSLDNYIARPDEAVDWLLR